MLSRRSQTLLATEIALWLVTVTAIVGMHRLFVDGSYRPALVLEAVVAHLTVALLRRRGVRLVPSALVTVAVGIATLTWVHYADTTAFLLPTGDTWSAASDDLRGAWQLFQDVKAPAPVETGFLLAGGAALWLMVFVADWAAFRAAATFEALLPSATLFLFAAALGAPGGRVAGATLYAATAMAFVLLQRTLNQEQSSTWAASHRTRGRWSLLGTGGVLIGVAVAAGAMAGPNLPGAEADPVLAWRDLNEDDPTKVVLSPMVDLQTRLVDQPDIEVFTVRSEVPQYWRVTSLDEFDGQIWRSSYKTEDADGSLPRAFEPSVDVTTLEQDFAVSNLGEVWLPAAFEPVAIDPGEGEVDWDERSSTLIVDRSLEASDGLNYSVTSQVPEWRDSMLREASDEVPGDIRDAYLQLPDLNDDVTELAEMLTADAPTQYDKAFALQNYLRSDQFTYNINAPKGHSSDALRSFLFTTREGYCEQFAGSFAVLARSVGLPARVAVGFTPGIQDEQDPTLWHVRGEHAHAWPEVYFEGFGWVPFEPTPGRAPAGAESWLGAITGDQGAGGGTGAIGGPGSAGPGTGQPSNLPTGGQTGDEQRIPGANDRDSTRTDAPSNAGKQGAELSGPMKIALLVIGFGILAYLVGVPAAIGTQRVLRRRRTHQPVERVRLAWRDAIDRAVAAGTALPASLTITETAERLTAAVPSAAAAVHRIAGAMEHVTYAEVAPSADEADQAMAARDTIVDEIRQRESLGARVVRYFDVRELWRRRETHARRSATSRPTSMLGA
jgi:transglutaminase-like putative cysteine protease